MAYDESLAARIHTALGRKKTVEEKRIFGGVGLLMNGNMLVGVGKKSLIVRLGPDGYEDALLEAHVTEFDILPRNAALDARLSLPGNCRQMRHNVTPRCLGLRNLRIIGFAFQVRLP
jgi:hypothetical protein